MVNLGNSTIPYLIPMARNYLSTFPNLGHKGLLANSFLERTKVQGINEAKTDGYTPENTTRNVCDRNSISVITSTN